MVKFKTDVSKTAIDEKDILNYKTLIKKIAENGDLVILGQKGTCKTTLLMHLCRELRKDNKNRLIIIETFPKWIHEFDLIPYMIIKDEQVQPKENKAFLEENKSFIQWSKDYDILNEKDVLQFLKENKDCLFMVQCEDMERITAFMSFIIYAIYRKQYQRAFYKRLEKVGESFWFLIEESHNLLDSTTVQKKTFQKLRKEQNEFRNLKMHLICVALRLQDLNPKIRSKMSILLSRISLDDFQLKIRALLRNSKFRDQITTLEKGSFVYPELDLKLTVEPFIQIGTPTEFKPTVKPTENKKETKNLSIFSAIKYLLNPFQTVPKGYEIKGNSEEDNIKQDELGDFLAIDEKLIFSEE
jgi:hypothetical protein